METRTEGTEVVVPVVLSGIVSRLDGIDFCMDGAKFRLQTMAGPARLKPANAEVNNFLERVAGTRLRVTIAGYPVVGPECSYISTYYAAPSQDVAKSLGIDKLLSEQARVPRGECQWTAIHDFMPPGPARLNVRGACTMPTPGFKVTLQRHEPQGINPFILLLDKIVAPPTGTEPRHPVEVVVEYHEKTDTHYTNVEILPDFTNIRVQEVH